VIVDVHTHTPRHRERPQQPGQFQRADLAPMRPDRKNPDATTWDDYLAAMRPVDRSICFNIAAPPADDPAPSGGPVAPARELNDETAAFVRAYPDQLIGFLAVHPRQPDALEEIERAVGDLGLHGVKLGPNYQNFDPLGEDAFRIYRRAQELRLPVLFHQGTSPARYADLDYAHPRHMDRVASAFPDLRIVMAHMAHPWQIDCIAVIRKHPHVYADISALFYRPLSYYQCMRLATEWSVLHKLLFGSDYPVATPQETIEALPRVNDIIEGTRLPPVPLDELDRIVQRDSLDLLGLG
jgi:predicted TIM-barrel fold metal-dependent hydrolase